MEKVITKVKIENLYKHIFNLEGPRHPIKDLDNLESAREYIVAELDRYGLKSHQQEFKVDGFDETFKNIEAYTSSDSQPQIILISHYDTVANCPGANDNASGVALMLECARVLAQENKDFNVGFLCFSLEEGDPYIELHCNKKAQELGMTDELNRYTSVKIHEFMSKYTELFYSFRSKGKLYIEANQAALNEMTLKTPPIVENYFIFWKELYEELDKKGQNYYTLGSELWLKEALDKKKQIKGILCFDTIAYTNKKLNSQWFPPSMSPKILRNIFKTHKVDFDEMVGNFISIIASKGSDEIIETFSRNASNELIDLPYAYAHFNIGYEQIAKTFPDLLRSDHGPFWRENIPGLFLTDTANFRFPYYHTQADTIEKLDFGFLTQITKATIATLIDLNTN
ncbi:MAG: Aminopeptidase YwaD [Promethearchaeota archaeon]|nr:MAG: Aminopeptidase YwaD [Candidatus Lokiarchaeota archaeon]